MITYTWSIVTTDFSLDAAGAPDRINTIHWRCDGVENEASAGSYGTQGVDLPATSTEAEVLAALQSAVVVEADAEEGTPEVTLQEQVEAGIADQLQAQSAPTSFSGRVWELPSGTVVWKEGTDYDSRFYWGVNTPKTLEQVAPLLIADIASARYAKESSGIIWTDESESKAYYLDTSVGSQNRFASVRIAIEAGERVDGGVWKCADVTDGEPVLTFRPTSNIEVMEWASLVHSHVQKCFEAEATCVTKIMTAEDVDAARAVDFDNEFNAL